MRECHSKEIMDIPTERALSEKPYSFPKDILGCSNSKRRYRTLDNGFAKV
jgi:hypothetical protein